MNTVKAGKLLHLIARDADVEGAINDVDDLAFLDKLHSIRSRPNADRVKALWSGDDYSDYLVTMYDVCLQYHTRLRLSGLWKAFVKLSHQRNALWVRTMPDWELSLRAPFEYVLRVVLRDECNQELQLVQAEQSFLLEDVKTALRFRYSEVQAYRNVLKPYALVPDNWRIDPYFKQLLAKAREILINDRVREIEGEMIQMDNPQYSFAW